MDLRLHAPRPDVVIVQVSGPVDGPAARLLADRVGKQLHRAPHVVLDLGDVSVLGRRGLTALSTLHQQAMARGTQLHIVGAEHDAVRRPLHATGLAQLLSLESTADAVIAALSVPVMSPVGGGRIGPDPDGEDRACGLGQDHACSQQWQDADLAMNIARRCFEGWLQASQEDRPSAATMHAYHTHEALHEAARAITLLIEIFRVEAMRRATTPAGSPVLTSRG